MTDIISVLVLLYTVSGETHESEHAMSHERCIVAADVITKGIADHTAPPVEMLDGTRVPLTGATCIQGCFADDPPGGLKLDIQAALRSDEEAEG